MNDFEMAAYLDRGLDPADRERVENHLAACVDCRQEWVAAHRLVRRAARPRRALIGITALAAAAMLVLMVRPAGVDPLRNGGAPPTLTAYGPIGEAPAGSIRFVWGAAPGATIYRVTLSGADGAPLWSGSVVDTAAALPDSVRLRTEERYVWIVDALLEDGSSRSTGVREFRLAP